MIKRRTQKQSILYYDVLKLIACYSPHEWCGINNRMRELVLPVRQSQFETRLRQMHISTVVRNYLSSDEHRIMSLRRYPAYCDNDDGGSDDDVDGIVFPWDKDNTREVSEARLHCAVCYKECPLRFMMYKRITVRYSANGYFVLDSITKHLERGNLITMYFCPRIHRIMVENFLCLRCFESVEYHRAPEYFIQDM